MHKYFGVGLYVFTLLISVIAASTPTACHTCQQSSRCYPPDCMCCKDLVSTNGTYMKELPQIVYFTFDDAVTSQAAQMYRKLFTADRKNPNGCRIKFTLFISHNYTDYEIVKEFYGQGMEIASHSVNHRSDLSLSQVRDEILRQKDNLVRLGNIPKDEVVGWRSPYLKPYGDHQVEILKEGGYLYDSTLTFSKGKRKPIYPFTLDYGWPFHCQIHDCPKKKHPGFWEVPVVSVHDKYAKYDCVYIDGCTIPPNTEEEAYNYLWDNFLNYYNGNRAPMGINMHAAWFFYNYPTDPYRLKAMDRFIQKLVSKRDVHIVTVRQMLDWVKDPVLSSQVNSIKSWQCDGVASSSWGGDLSGKSQQSTYYGNDYVYNRYEKSSNLGKQTKEDFFGLGTSLFGSQTPEIFEPIDNKPQNSRSTGSIRKDKPENIFREEEEQARFLVRTKMVEERQDKVARTHQTTRYLEAGRTEAIKRANAQDQANMASVTGH